MKQIMVMLGAALLFVAAVGAASAAGLRSEVVVAGDRIRLGDLFEGLPAEQALVEVARAPATGRTVTLETDWIVRVALAYGVDWTPGRRQGRIEIRRAGAEELASLAAGIHDDLSDFIDRAHRPDRAVGRGPSAHGSASGAAADAAEHESVDEAPTIRLPVLVRRARHPHVITAADIGWIEIEADRRTLELVVDPEEMIGMSPRRTIPAHEPVRLHDLEEPIIVSRGDTVTMVLRQGRMLLTARGRALDDGARGDAVRVLNNDSNLTIDAVVSGPETVTVRLATQLASLR